MYTVKSASTKQASIFTTLRAMTTYTVDDEEFAALKGKTVLITGSVTGIGRATVHLAYGESRRLIHAQSQNDAAYRVY